MTEFSRLGELSILSAAGAKGELSGWTKSTACLLGSTDSCTAFHGNPSNSY